MVRIGKCVGSFRMCRGGFKYSNGGSCDLMCMLWLMYLIFIFRVFGVACVGHGFVHWL